MISICYYPDLPYHYVSMGPSQMFSEELPAGPAPSIFSTIGHIMLVNTPNFTDLQLTEKSVRFGWMIQGKKPFGALRDKDVQHLNATGRLVCNSVGTWGNPYTNPNGISATTFGRVLTFGSTQRLVLGCIPWGSDYSFVGTTPPMGTYESRYVGTACFGSSTVMYTVRVHFDGDYAVYERTMSAVVGTVGPQSTPWSSPAKSYCRFYQRKSGSNGWIKMSSGYTATSGNKGYGYYMPNGTIASPMLVQADPRVYGITCVNSCETFTNVTIPGVGDTSTLVDFIERAILSNDTVRWVWQMFEMNPDNFDCGELGSDILKTQKYIDANLLLTAFDLVGLTGDLEGWREYAKFLHTAGKTILKYGIKSVKQFTSLLKHMSKKSASRFLGVDYGILPTVRDGERVVRGVAQLWKNGIEPTRKHARRTSVVETGFSRVTISQSAVLTVEVGTYPDGFLLPQMKEIDFLKRSGFWPDIAMLYDALPYSFVVDWFTNFVSDNNKRMDDIIDSQYFPINYCVYSTKREFSPRLEAWLTGFTTGISGSVAFTLYNRELTRELILPSSQTGEGASPGFHNWAEAAALIVQKIK